MQKTSLPLFFFSTLLVTLIAYQPLLATGCPGCQVDLPAGMPADTLFLSDIPDGEVGQAYNQDVSFRLPKTTTPVNATDPTIPAGLTINQIVISSIANLPPGLSWEANQTLYLPADQTDGCIKLCGTPLLPGWYTMEVTVTATVLVINRQTSFPIEVYIAPAASTNDGFTLTNTIGCGSVAVSFTNNLPSNGNQGYSYSWDFGNGHVSSDENPAVQVYDQPGTYYVNYTANFDTVGYILTDVTVLQSDCDDFPTAPAFSSAPDLLIKVRAPDGSLIYQSARVDNKFPPVSFPTNIIIGDGNYTLESIDEDSGINGADDQCVFIAFNRLSNGVLDGPDFQVSLSIIHPLASQTFTDTIVVLPLPDAPEVSNSADAFCPGESVLLESSYPADNQWYFNGGLIAGATGSTFEAEEGGVYQVEYTNSFGCQAISEPLEIMENPLPATPEVFSSKGNELCEGESTLLASSYPNGNQWYLNGQAVDGRTTPGYSVNASGSYQVEYTSDLGCKVISMPYLLTVHPLPQLPGFSLSADNILMLSDTVALPVENNLQWYLDGIALEGEISTVLCATSDGDYALEVTDLMTGCINTFTATIMIHSDADCSITGTREVHFSELTIAPNPVTSLLQISMELVESQDVSLRLFDMTGREVKSFTYGKNAGYFQKTLDISDLSPAMYILRVQVGGVVENRKVMKG